MVIVYSYHPDNGWKANPSRKDSAFLSGLLAHRPFASYTWWIVPGTEDGNDDN